MAIEQTEPYCPEGTDVTDRNSYIFRGRLVGVLVNKTAYHRCTWREPDKAMIRAFLAKGELDRQSIKTVDLTPLLRNMRIDLTGFDNVQCGAIATKIRSSLDYNLKTAIQNGSLVEQYKDGRPALSWPADLRRRWIEAVSGPSDVQSVKEGGNYDRAAAGGGARGSIGVDDNDNFEDAMSIDAPSDKTMRLGNTSTAQATYEASRVDIQANSRQPSAGAGASPYMDWDPHPNVPPTQIQQPQMPSRRIFPNASRPLQQIHSPRQASPPQDFPHPQVSQQAPRQQECPSPRVAALLPRRPRPWQAPVSLIPHRVFPQQEVYTSPSVSQSLPASPTSLREHKLPRIPPLQGATSRWLESLPLPSPTPPPSPRINNNRHRIDTSIAAFKDAQSALLGATHDIITACSWINHLLTIEGAGRMTAAQRRLCRITIVMSLSSSSPVNVDVSTLTSGMLITVKKALERLEDAKRRREALACQQLQTALQATRVIQGEARELGMDDLKVFAIWSWALLPPMLI